MPPGYRWQDDGPEAGLWLDPPPSEERERPMRLAGVFKVAAETHDAEGDSWGLLLQWRDPAGRQHEWAMPRAMLAERKAAVWAILAGGGLFIAASEKARNRLADFLNLCRPNVRAIAVERTGWQDGLFVMPGRAYGAHRAELAVYQGAPLPKGFTASRGTLEAWQQDIAAKADGNTRLVLCLAAAFVGPVMDLIGAEGGGIHLRGDTSSGKTTCLKAAASVWGDHSAWVQTWRSTANGIESTATQHSETLLCLDELRELTPRDAVTVPYMLAHGRAKGRQRAEGGLRRQAQWRVFFLSTGELALADLAAQAGDKPAGGTDVRMIDIAADAGCGRGVWEALHAQPNPRAFADALNDAIGSNYGTAAPAFLERLAADKDGAREMIRASIDGWTAANVPADASAMVQRAGKRFALVAAAGDLARTLGVLPWREGMAERAIAKLFKEWCEARGGHGAPEDERAMEALRGFLATHGDARFQGPETGEQRPVQNRAGWWRYVEDNVSRRQWFVTPAAWREIAKDAGLPAERVAAAAKAAGWLIPGRDRAAQSVALAGFPKQRLYVICPQDAAQEHGQ
jgi:putative DNA primase/helicase